MVVRALTINPRLEIDSSKSDIESVDWVGVNIGNKCVCVFFSLDDGIGYGNVDRFYFLY